MAPRINTAPYTNLFTLSIEAFQGQLMRFFPGRKPIQAVSIFNDADIAAISRKEGKPSFPFFTTRLTNVIRNDERRNNFVLRTFGKPMRNRAPGNTMPGNLNERDLILHPMQVTASFEVHFVTNDARDVYDFTQRWIDNSQMRFMDFDLRVTENDPIRIRVNCDPSIDFPVADDNDDTGKLFTAVTTASINTYFATETTQPKIRQYRVNLFNVEDAENDGIADADLITHRDFDVDNDGGLNIGDNYPDELDESGL